MEAAAAAGHVWTRTAASLGPLSRPLSCRRLGLQAVVAEGVFQLVARALRALGQVVRADRREERRAALQQLIPPSSCWWSVVLRARERHARAPVLGTWTGLIPVLPVRPGPEGPRARP
eukprot:15436662-Alexandrium_andersonii.AAC.1